MSAQINRYGSILEKQRQRVQSGAMLKPLRGVRHSMRPMGAGPGLENYGGANDNSIDGTQIDIGLAARFKTGKDDKSCSDLSQVLPAITGPSKTFARVNNKSALKSTLKARASQESLLNNSISKASLEKEEKSIRKQVQSQYFKESSMTEEFLKRKKDVRKGITNLNSKCEKSHQQTKRTLKKLSEQLEEEVFIAERNEFVTTTLQEFDNLDPSSLDVIFEYKADDLMHQKEEV